MRDGWIETTLGEVIEHTIGGAWGGEPGSQEVNVHVVRSTEFTKSGYLNFNTGVTRSIKYSQLKSRELKSGDILLEKSGGGPDQPVGRVVFVTSEIPEKTVCSNFVQLIRPDNDQVNSFFLFLVLWRWHSINRTLEFQAQTTGIRNLRTPDYLEQTFKLPPLAEQKRIVDLISSVDSYIEAIQQQVDKARKSRNAVLHEFLARDWEGSVETTLGEVATWGSGGTPKADNSKFYGGNIPWCVIGDLNEGDVFDTEKKITDLGLKNSSAKKIEPGHVLIAMYGASIGKTGIAAIEMATNQAIAFAKVHENLVTNRYLLIYLQSQKNKFVEAGQGAAQPNISQTVLKSWRFSLPPIDVQHGLVKVISSFDNQIQGLEKTNSKTKDLRSALLSELLSGNHEIPTTYDSLIGAA